MSAQTADLAVHTQRFFDSPVHAGAEVPWRVDVNNQGGNDASNVSLLVDVPAEIEAIHVSSIFGSAGSNPACDLSARPVKCTAASLHAGGLISVTFVASAPSRNGDFTITESASSATADPNPANNSDAFTFTASAAPELIITATGFNNANIGDAYPGGPWRFALSYRNLGASAAHDVVITGQLPPGSKLVAARPLACSESNLVVTCTAPLLANGAAGDVQIDLLLPENREGGVVASTFTINSNDPQFSDARRSASAAVTIDRELIVTNPEDDGVGSLRQAIRDANAFQDGPVLIGFEIPSDGVHTIRPQTPLPEITGASVNIDARTQAKGTIELDGSLQIGGNGLVLRQGCRRAVFGLAINGFTRGAGIGILPNAAPQTCASRIMLIAENSIGAGAPNNQGIGIIGGSPAITGNVISGNRRSGIYLFAGSAAISDNQIVGNGASGVFVNDGVAYTQISHNTIASNRGFGVALGSHSIETSITRNSIKSNDLLGIDIGLDSVTPNAPSDVTRYPNAPVLGSAKYDPVANTTIITGRLDSDAAPDVSIYTIELFTSDALNALGQAQGETSLGTTGSPGNNGHFDFTFTAPGDLTGKWITATNTRTHGAVGITQVPQPRPIDGGLYSATSEFSNAVQATR